MIRLGLMTVLKDDMSIEYVYYKNGIVTPVDEMPKSFVEKGCCCGCDGGGGDVDITTLDFSKLPEYPTNADASLDAALKKGALYTLIDDNTMGLPYEAVYVKKS